MRILYIGSNSDKFGIKKYFENAYYFFFFRSSMSELEKRDKSAAADEGKFLVLSFIPFFFF